LKFNRKNPVFGSKVWKKFGKVRKVWKKFGKSSEILEIVFSELFKNYGKMTST
jgi:hypothetical protein